MKVVVVRVDLDTIPQGTAGLVKGVEQLLDGALLVVEWLTIQPRRSLLSRDLFADRIALNEGVFNVRTHP